MPAKHKRTFIATIDDNKIDQIDTIAQLFRDAGINVKEILNVSGIIIGETTDLKAVKKFRAEGVVSVEEDGKARAI